MDGSPFRRLPPELRVRIFEYVLYLSDDTGTIVFDDKGPKLPTVTTQNHRQALTGVCRVTRAESYALIYNFKKLYFSPYTLDKYDPAFFWGSSLRMQQRIHDYLRSFTNWHEIFTVWLEHVGPEIFNKIESLDVNIGGWKSGWSSVDSPVVVYIMEELAELVWLFRHSATTVNLGFNFDTGYWGPKDPLQMALPVSNMEFARCELDKRIQDGKDLVSQRHLRIWQRWSGFLDERSPMLHAWIACLESTIHNRIERSRTTPD